MPVTEELLVNLPPMGGRRQRDRESVPGRSSHAKGSVSGK